MISILALFLQAAAAPAPATAPVAPWTPTTGTASATVRASSREGTGRLAVRCDTSGINIVSIQFVPTVALGDPVAPGHPVSLTVDGATPFVANWEIMGRGIIERDDAAVTTIAAAFAHAKTIKLHTTGAAGQPIDATFDGPPSDAGIVQVLTACGYTLGTAPVRADPKDKKPK